jgi:hypothetical protein
MHGPRLAAVLFFVAGALALAASVGGFVRTGGPITWRYVLAGLFLAAMGETMRRKSPRT